MGCFNEPAWKVCGWVADTNYLYPARWGQIKKLFTSKWDILNFELNWLMAKAKKMNLTLLGLYRKKCEQII